MTCTQCDNTGLVDAVDSETKGRYFFKCFCRHGVLKQMNLPVWQNPTKGFVLRIVVPDEKKEVQDLSIKDDEAIF